jgi:hypothetical protein
MERDTQSHAVRARAGWNGRNGVPRRYYALWLVAMFLAESGAAFDVSYHFGHLFDYFSPPHLTVAVGVFTMIGLLAWALVLRRDQVTGFERKALWAAAIALAVGIADEPLDLLYHLTFGVDITLWSPTHLMLNFPTDVANVCILAALLASPAARARGSWAIGFGLLFRNLLTMHFALYQQEYGAVALDALNRSGRVPWYVEPALVRLVGPRATLLVTGGVPSWLYLIYFAFAMSYALTLAGAVLYRWQVAGTRRLPDRWPWPFGAATALALAFIAWRLLFRALFLTIHAAHPVIPWYIVPMGVVIDVALLAGPGWLGRAGAALSDAQRRFIISGGAGVVASLALYGGIVTMRAAHITVPAAPAEALPFACLTGALGATLGAWVGARVRELATIVVVRRPAPKVMPAAAVIAVTAPVRSATPEAAAEA